jgi:ATP/maltotriose-dependent transcriptional regulator MalT
MKYHLEGRMIFEQFGDIAGVAYTTSRMSMAAYGLGDYANAWMYGKEGKEAFGEIGHRWGVSTSLCRMGFASVGGGDLRKAWECFQEALSRAQQEEMIPLALYAIIGMACVLVEVGELGRGVALLATAKAHEKTPTIYLDLAERWFEGIEDKLSAESHAEATAQGESHDPKKVIEELLQTESLPATT